VSGGAAAAARTVAIVQARIGSSRLPGKVLLPLSGRSVLAHVIERAQTVPGVDAVWVATTVEARDAAVEAEALRAGAQVYRGSETDVLARYAEAADRAAAAVVIRITSDCPLLDPALVGEMLAWFRARATGGDAPVDYLSNGLERRYPRGLDAEIFTTAALALAHREARAPHEREHVTPFLYQHPERFRIHAWTGAPDRSHLRWTLDTPEDYAMLQAVHAALGADARIRSTESIVAWLAQHPEVVALNADVAQKALPTA
jgi:spore coat polysaccharide biosynthesis protein SpsF